MAATDRPDFVRAVILAVSQASKVPADIAPTPSAVADPTRREAERLATLRKAFFAPRHDARTWLAGWYPATLRMQHEATRAVPPSAYWACGRAPMLEVLGALDPFNPKAYWQDLEDQFGERVTSVMIEDASHALFPEQLGRIPHAILPWLAITARRCRQAITTLAC